MTESKQINFNNNVKKLISKQSQLTKKTYTNTIYKNELLIYLFINIILFSILFYLMIKNK